MSHVSIQNMTKNFDGKPPTVAVDDLSLDIEEGEFLVLLGPSGCGKTTTLRCLAGLETPAAGTIQLGGATVFDGARKLNLSPDKRFIGMVFQSYALWPHMTVRKNIGYPLKARGLTDLLKNGQIEHTAALVDCEKLLDRLPAQLSGGQQQRVALARGLVAQPDLVLFDEPLSNLDARLRDQVRAELHELHQRKPFTAVFVTHDQSEALALGTRMAIMKAGRIEQLGTPKTVFEEPVSEYVADFIGMSNRLECTYVDGQWSSAGVPLSGTSLRPPTDDSVIVARLRPDDVRLVAQNEDLAPQETGLAAEVIDVEFGGRHYDVMLAALGDGAGVNRIHARISTRDSNRVARNIIRGDRLVMAFDPTNARFFGADGSSLDEASVAEPPRIRLSAGTR